MSLARWLAAERRDRPVLGWRALMCLLTLSRTFGASSVRLVRRVQRDSEDYMAVWKVVESFVLVVHPEDRKRLLGILTRHDLV